MHQHSYTICGPLKRQMEIDVAFINKRQHVRVYTEQYEEGIYFYFVKLIQK